MRNVKLIVLCTFLLGIVPLSFANTGLNIEITQGIDAPIPTLVIPFKVEGESALLPESIHKVIQHDLNYSGRFNTFLDKVFKQQPHTLSQVNFSYWRALKADNLIIGKIVVHDAEHATVNFELIDVFRTHNQHKALDSQQLLAQSFEIDPKEIRRLGHHISDLVFEQLIGMKGTFATRIAYVTVMEQAGTRQYTLEVSDSDGHNPQRLLNSYQPIMSPVWSFDAKKIAYVSFEQLRAQIYMIDVATGVRTLISHFPGSNGAPAFSPDDTQLALVLSKDGAPNIYTLNLTNKKLTQITHGYANNTEPRFSPDGKSLLFTSNRGGSPQIYRIFLRNGKIKRLTYAGSYNARASFTPDGKSIVMMHRQKGHKKFNIAVQKLDSDRVQLLSNTRLDESPSISPNGDMVLYATQEGVHSALAAVSIDGRVHVRLPFKGRSVQEPAWSPFYH